MISVTRMINQKTLSKENERLSSFVLNNVILIVPLVLLLYHLLDHLLNRVPTEKNICGRRKRRKIVNGLEKETRTNRSKNVREKMTSMGKMLLFIVVKHVQKWVLVHANKSTKPYTVSSRTTTITTTKKRA